MPCFQGARLDDGGQILVMLREHRNHLTKRDRTVAEGAADEAIALICPLHPVVLEVDVADMAGYATGEGDRRLADRKRVGGIEADADTGPGFLAEADEFLAPEILVVLDREPHAGGRSLGAVLAGRG